MTIGKLIPLFCNLCSSGAATLIPTVIEFFFKYILCQPYTRAENLSSVQPACSFLPEDMLINIISKLPAKSLLRCRCVCKTWHQIMDTPGFAKTHLTYQTTSSSSSSSCKYILYEDYRKCTLFSDSEPLYDSTKFPKLYYTHRLIRNVSRYTQRLRIYGVCNGLLCLSEPCYQIDHTIHLWNPICRKVKKLPQLKISMEDGNEIHPRGFVSFGYYDDDYKVVVIASVDNTFIVSIYGLSTDTWNTIHTNFFFEYNPKALSSYGNQATKFVDGAAYVVFYSSRVVICFKLIDETIQAIKFPEGFSGIHSAIEAYGETICFLGSENDYLTMWILRDKSSSSTSPWENKFRIELKDAIHHQAVGFLKNEKYLMRTFHITSDLRTVTNLFLCDVECGTLTEFRSLTEFSFEPDYFPAKYPYNQGRIHSNFVESLLLLNEESVHPFVQPEMGSCSSVLFTLL